MNFREKEQKKTKVIIEVCNVQMHINTKPVDAGRVIHSDTFFPIFFSNIFELTDWHKGKINAEIENI